MNKKRVKSYLSTGVIVGFLIDFLVILIIGVSEKKLDNYIYNGLCATFPTLVTLLFINIELFKFKRINLKKFIISILISIIVSFILGMLIELFIIEVINVKVWDIHRLLSSIYKSLIGVFIGIIVSNVTTNLITKN